MFVGKTFRRCVFHRCVTIESESPTAEIGRILVSITILYYTKLRYIINIFIYSVFRLAHAIPDHREPKRSDLKLKREK